MKGGAQKGGYIEVTKSQIVSDKALAEMTATEKADGFEVNDPSHDRYYVPLDKAAESDIDEGLLSLFWRPVDFYVDWSKQSVSAMKALHQKGGVFRNPKFYFKRGISFSNTGIYSPTFRLSHGGVFDQKGSNIFCEVLNERFLLGVLGSTLTRYFAKAFINHGVDAQLDDLPIVLPNEKEATSIIAVVDDIVAAQKLNTSYDYRPRLAELDALIVALYGLTDIEREELSTWYRRHYPRLTGDGSDEE